MPNQRYNDLVSAIGKAGVHSLFPNDFELYIMTLELVDSQGATIDFLSFPVNPERFTYEDPALVNIKKSLGGISALDTETFNPKMITMSGTFGRRLRLLISPPSSTEINSERSTDGGVYGNIADSGLQIKTEAFDARLKTGYGTLKILESIVEKSKGLDSNNEPFRLYFYNPTLNHNFLVKITKFSAMQDRTNSNILWRYDIAMTAIAPLANLRDRVREELGDLTDSNRLLRTSTTITGGVQRVINQLRRQTRKTKKVKTSIPSNNPFSNTLL